MSGSEFALDPTPATAMKSPLHVYLVGAHSTGKTTLARWIRDTYGMPMISEVARGVLAEMEAQLDSLRTDVALVDRYQAEVFQRQIEAEEAQTGSFVSDRAFCNLAYAAQHSTIMAGVARDPRLQTYMGRVRQGLVFFLRPHQALLAEDGVRAGVEWEEVLRIDGMVKIMLEMFDVPYIPVQSLPMQERIRLVQRVLELAGASPKGTAPEEFDDLIPRAETYREVLPSEARAKSKSNGNREPVV